MTEPSRKLPVRAKHVPWLVISLILLIMAVTVAIITINLRRGLRAQIIQQDGLMLYAASMVRTDVSVYVPEDMKNDPEMIQADLELRSLSAAKQKGVLALQIFDEGGDLFFEEKEEKKGPDTPALSADELARLRSFETISSYEKNGTVIKDGTQIRAELIRALIPLGKVDPLAKDAQFIGAAEFLLDGRSVGAELEKLDRNLLKYSFRIFLLGGGIMTLSLWWAFGRLQKALKMLEERTASLLRANHELTLSAKTSAVGAITAHLIHDLKSPLFGLQSFVTARGAADEEDWDMALSTTQRMQKMIASIVKILQDEKTSEQYELSVGEVLSLLREKLGPECEKAGIEFKTEGSMGGQLVNRDGNIVLMLITNLVHNAIQAVPKDGEICVKVSNEDGQALFQIRDTGPGLPEHIRATLFTPSRSTKAGGTGLGLAISKQLANHIGADLTLKESTKAGTVFELRVPERMLNSEFVTP
ncbi:MAG: sensor histidine kinase [Limisphaerales bacterium]